MPDHTYHRHLHIKYAPLFLPPAILTAYMLSGWYMSMFVVIGYVLERWWNADLDHKGHTKTEIEIRRIPIIGPYITGHTAAFAQIIAWLPPVFGFPRGHNSFWSHFPPVGAFLLLVWAWWPFLLCFRYFWLDDLTVEFWGLYVGLQAACWIHSLADLFYNDRNLPINETFWWFRRR